MNPIKILLVDDSKSARYALRLHLQQQGMQVDTADSAEAALERIPQSRPEAVLMDHTMPGMNGFEALDSLKSDAATVDIPVVMCTSHDDPAYAAQALKRGALTVLSKADAADRLPDVLGQIRAALAARAELAATPAGAPVEAAPAAPAGLTCLKDAAAGKPQAAFNSRTNCQLLKASRKLIYPGLPFKTSKGSSPGFINRRAGF